MMRTLLLAIAVLAGAPAIAQLPASPPQTLSDTPLPPPCEPPLPHSPPQQPGPPAPAPCPTPR